MKKDIKKLIKLHDEDFRDNIKGQRLVDFIDSMFEVKARVKEKK